MVDVVGFPNDCYSRNDTKLWSLAQSCRLTSCTGDYSVQTVVFYACIGVAPMNCRGFSCRGEGRPRAVRSHSYAYVGNIYVSLVVFLFLTVDFKSLCGALLPVNINLQGYLSNTIRREIPSSVQRQYYTLPLHMCTYR